MGCSKGAEKTNADQPKEDGAKPLTQEIKQATEYIHNEEYHKVIELNQDIIKENGNYIKKDKEELASLEGVARLYQSEDDTMLIRSRGLKEVSITYKGNFKEYVKGQREALKTQLMSDIENKDFKTNFYVYDESYKPEYYYYVYFIVMRSRELNNDIQAKYYIDKIPQDYKGAFKEEINDLRKVINKEFEEEQEELNQIALKEKIANTQPGIGMTTNEVINETNWGKPLDINKTTTINGVREQWVYGGSRYLYFEDGILTTIQE
ncbi:hypothetical protein P5663_16245 [Priestia flexa]|uniref:hypothetical protein n=1 Tax=Priestia flexa TaxID=86664 RepID=UPI00240E2C64|nr:hypothetical protein [Priestia flexa]WEZ07569.1 hypothetical protein P5663_16245 [Priestia flexa]